MKVGKAASPIIWSGGSYFLSHISPTCLQHQMELCVLSRGCFGNMKPTEPTPNNTLIEKKDYITQKESKRNNRGCLSPGAIQLSFPPVAPGLLVLLESLSKTVLRITSPPTCPLSFSVFPNNILNLH